MMVSVLSNESFLNFRRRVNTVGAIHGLLWLTPRNLVEGLLGRDGFLAVDVDGGFTEIFRHMLRLAKVEPLFDTEVLVSRQEYYLLVDSTYEKYVRRISYLLSGVHVCSRA